MPDDLKTGIGASVKRKEDFRFLTGKGRYTDDINRPNQVYAYMLRSNVARGSLKLDISKAKSSPGVEDIIIGKDMDENDDLALIDFNRIKGGKPFDHSLSWFKEILLDIGQKN